MGMYLRENGIYYLKIREHGKYKRISLETKDIYTAKEIYNAYLLDKLKSKLITNRERATGSSQIIYSNPIQEKKPQIKLNKIEPIYLEYIESCQLKGLEPATIWYKKVLLKDLQQHKIINLEDLSQKKLNEVVQFWNKEKPSCIPKQSANLKAFLNYCIKSQKFNSATYHSLTFPSTTTTGIRETIITEFDYQQILDYVHDENFKLYLETLWETGCRPNEIIKLTKSDIDFTKGTAFIYQNKTKKYKTVYLTDKLLQLFKNITTPYFFEGHNKQREFYAKRFRQIRFNLNLNKEYCLYAFRHSFGTRILNKTKDIHLVSKLLGHSDISITAKHYINRSDSEIRAKLMS